VWGNLEKLAENLGLDPSDPKFQEGVMLAKHVKDCKYCGMLWASTNEITLQHSKESQT